MKVSHLKEAVYMRTSRPIWRKILWSLIVVLVNLLAAPIGIYFLFAFSPGTVISNWDIVRAGSFILLCNIISLQLFIAIRKRPNPYTYSGLLLAILQLAACCLYMSLYTKTAYILFAAAILLSIVLLIKTIKQKDPAII